MQFKVWSIHWHYLSKLYCFSPSLPHYCDTPHPNENEFFSHNLGRISQKKWCGTPDIQFSSFFRLILFDFIAVIIKIIIFIWVNWTQFYGNYLHGTWKALSMGISEWLHVIIDGFYFKMFFLLIDYSIKTLEKFIELWLRFIIRQAKQYNWKKDNLWRQKLLMCYKSEGYFFHEISSDCSNLVLTVAFFVIFKGLLCEKFKTDHLQLFPY